MKTDATPPMRTGWLILLTLVCGWAATACGAGSEGFVAACRARCTFDARCSMEDQARCNDTCDVIEEDLQARGQNVVSECNDAGEALADCLDGAPCSEPATCESEEVAFERACGVAG